jgi:hypothetical protein
MASFSFHTSCLPASAVTDALTITQVQDGNLVALEIAVGTEYFRHSGFEKNERRRASGWQRQKDRTLQGRSLNIPSDGRKKTA